jgi:heme ABC exporter ATP-binding subunit CcmA
MKAASTELIPERFHLSRAVTLVGRAPHADLRLPHPAISRRHAELRLQGDCVQVRDLGSRSGVLLNGKLVKDAEAHDNDVLSFGPLAYELRQGQLRRVLTGQGVRVEVRGLTCERGDRVVLDGVNLTIPPNNFIGILGPSGAGKTTLLKAMTGFLPVESGSIVLDGLDLEEHREVCQSMFGFVPQDDVVHGALTARENLDYALRLRVAGDLRAEERAAWVAQTLHRLALEEHADRPVHTLSGGQRKRVNVGVELLTRPRLLFLDEPTAGLDPAAEARLMEFLREQAHRGMTIVCTTHVLESLHLFDAVMVVAGGQLLGSGKPQNLLAHFQCKTYAQLYEKLENPPAAPKRANLPAPSVRSAPSRGLVRSRRSPFGQIGTLLRRNLLLLGRDRLFLALLVGQPVLIGLLINLSQWNYSPDRTLDLIATFAVVASIWLGLNNTAREIIRDRAIYVRERRAALNPESYLIAKVLLFGFIGLVQVVILVLWIRYATFLRWNPDEGNWVRDALQSFPVVKYILVLWLTYLASMFLGVLISTLATTEEVAVAVLPLLILPQLLLTGIATNTARDGDGYFESLPVMLKRMDKDSRTPAGWACEGVSLATYSRPALVLLKFTPESETRPGSPAADAEARTRRIVDWSHLLLLLLLTATAFVMVFVQRERRWLEAG